MEYNRRSPALMLKSVTPDESQTWPLTPKHLWGIFGTTESEASPEQGNCQEGGSWADKTDKKRPFPLKNNHFQAKKRAKTMVCSYWLINSKKS
jgi:hypothetical protein